MTTFDRVIEFILRWEGGYSHDPRDPGGETKYGISKAANPDVDIKNLTVEQAKGIYRKRYWDRIGGDRHDYPTALALMDFAVHSGVDTALEFWGADEGLMDAWSLQQARRKYLTSLSTFPTYGRGWMRRLNALDDELARSVVSADVELVQVYYKDNLLEFKPTKVSVGPSRSGRRKIMVRLD